MTNSYVPNPFEGMHSTPYTSPAPEDLAMTTHTTMQEVEQMEHVQVVADCQSLMEHVLSELQRIAHITSDPDVQVMVAKVLTDSAKQAGNIKNRPKEALYHRYGHGTHATPGGLKFSIAKPSASRRVDYKILEKNHPDVYQEVVKVSQPGPETIGTLTIK